MPMTWHTCSCGSGETYTWILYDARNIACGRVCDKCEAKKKARYRPEVFTDSNYWADEPIEPDE